jgi:capsule polysaccharide export protein KpsE/RkpR
MSQAKEALFSAELAFQQVQQKKGLVQPEEQAKAVIESISALHAKVAAKEVEVTALRSFSTEHSPELQMAESQLASLQVEAAKLEQQTHSSGFGDLGLADVPGAGLDYLRAEHDLKYQQALFDLLLKQYDAAKLDEAKESAVIQVVEKAIEPDHKSFPQRTMLLLMSVLLGLILGCLSALVMWWRQLVQADPVATQRLAELDQALRGR